MAKQDDFTRYTIRVPTSLYERLKEAAGVKSVNAEIVERLEATFIRDDQLTGFESEMADLKKSVREIQIAFALMKAGGKPDKPTAATAPSGSKPQRIIDLDDPPSD